MSVERRDYMLIRFSVENYLSFKKRQVFSMVAGKHTRHQDHLAVVNGKRLLKGSVLFGANAAGKSNLIKAVQFGKNIVFDGVGADKTFNSFFRIEANYIETPGIFQYEFVSNGHFYSYGLAISYKNNTILSEWLYLVDREEKKLFDRDEKGGIQTNINFTEDENRKRFEIYAQDVPNDKTFLFEIVRHKLRDSRDFEGFYDAIEWFSSLIIIFPQSKYLGYNQYIMNNSLESIGRLMNYFDTGIEELRGEERDIEKVLSFLPEQVKSHLINDIQKSFTEEAADKTSIALSIDGRRFSFSKVDGRIVAHQLMMNHGNQKDLFELSDESDGTKRLFDLVPLYKKGAQNAVILVDELDRSFHSKLTMKFIQTFYEQTDGKNTQLIMTLHDSNILNLDLLRQDEIWFVERKEDHSSEVYSLNQFKDRFDHSVANDYLLGRYGAIPHFGIAPWNEGEE